MSGGACDERLRNRIGSGKAEGFNNSDKAMQYGYKRYIGVM